MLNFYDVTVVSRLNVSMLIYYFFFLINGPRPVEQPTLVERMRETGEYRFQFFSV